MKCVGCGEEIDLTCTNCDHEKLQLRKVESGSNNSLGLEYFECSHCKEQIQGFQHKCESYVDGYYGEVIFKQAGTDLKRNRDNFFKSNGQIDREENYKNGKKDGKSTSWWECF